MKHLQLLAASLLLLTASACHHANTVAGTADSSHSGNTAGADNWVTYTGILPCTDCNGIQTELTIHEQPSNPDPDYAFRLRETYQGLGGKDQTFNSEGTYSIVKGSATDPDAAVLLLNPEKDKNLQRYFIKVGDRELRPLDAQLQSIPNTPVLKRGNTGTP
ncbi:copper resistance protein NlpE [Chitinophaga vietnamensis]|uniref:copper resistance protein NlpE n=1 Tax=Chitinophaga vietnamensis TaxID=2593957 RepID=UPI001178A71D|nr:copper resistance protein NlpE [Chitinophaga vietnamensis]